MDQGSASAASGSLRARPSRINMRRDRLSVDTGSTAVSTSAPFVKSASSSMLGKQYARPDSRQSVDQEEDLRNKLRRSLHFGKSNEIVKDATESEEKDKRQGGGIRGLIRRTSISIKSKVKPRRNTLTMAETAYDTQDTRPATSSSKWHMLRNAASFMHSKSVFEQDVTHPVDSCDDLGTPASGIGNAPPPLVSHRGRGGMAARATAALQNSQLEKVERLGFLNPRPRLLEDPQGDRESGVGIAVTGTDETAYTALQAADHVSKVDFVCALPLELAIQILSNLDDVSLTRAALVSKTWNRISSSGHVWREAYCRDWSGGYAISRPLKPGDGHGVPPVRPNMPWKAIHRARKQLKDNWSKGSARHIYLSGHLDSIYCVQFDENKIITGSRDKTVRVWNQHTLKCDLIIGPSTVVNERKIMFGENGEHIHRFPVKSGNKQGYCPRTVSFDIHHNASILCLQYDSEILVTGSSDGTAIVHDIKNGYKPIRRLAHHTAAILDLAFDDRYIITCSKDITICIWDRKTGDMIKQLRGHNGPVNAVQMRGNTIVSCSGDFKVKLWNIDTGKCIREFIGHTKGLACSQFSDDAKYIASAGNDKVIRIWDANTGECLQTINAHDNLVRSLHICSVSGRLISGSYDQDIKVFDMATGRLLLDFPKWHFSWVLGAKSDYRRIISTGQDPKILIMDFGQGVEGLHLLECGQPMEKVA